MRQVNSSELPPKLRKGCVGGDCLLHRAEGRLTNGTVHPLGQLSDFLLEAPVGRAEVRAISRDQIVGLHPLPTERAPVIFDVGQAL